MSDHIQQLVGAGQTDMRKIFLTGRAELFVVGAALGKADLSIWAAPYVISIIFILAIILPETNSADIESPALVERLIAAARAPKWKILRLCHVTSLVLGCLSAV
ncbi:hypothetical protein ASF73_05815 [Xanthomonas sp. Leaf131]|nr:hypothetical protein ASF73_05815 [Xanthomonas sp. Leaf131]